MPRADIPAMIRLLYKNTPPPDKRNLVLSDAAHGSATSVPLMISIICNGIFRAFETEAAGLADDIRSGVDLLIVPDTPPDAWAVPLAARVDTGEPFPAGRR